MDDGRHQLWINLPAKEKMKPPHYQEFAAAKIPHVELADGGYIKVIAGAYITETQKTSGPVTGVTVWRNLIVIFYLFKSLILHVQKSCFLRACRRI